MAKEINLSLHLAMADHGIYPFLGVTQELDGSGAKTCNDQTVGTSAEAVDLGDIAAPAGLIMVVNRDTTNYVELALDSGMTQKFAKLKPGEFACWQPAVAGAVYALANTAACICTVFAFSTVAANAYSMHTTGQVSDALSAAWAMAATIAGDTIASSGRISNTTIPLADYAENAGLLLKKIEAAAGIVAGTNEVYLIAVLLDGDPVELAIDSGMTDQFAKLPSPGSCIIVPTPFDTEVHVQPSPNLSHIAYMQITRSQTA